MQWTPSSHIKPVDTISSLEFGPSNCLACTTWSGSVYVATPDNHSTLETQVSRPLFASSWHCSEPKSWYGGAEARSSLLDATECTTTDIYECKSAVLALKSMESGVLAGSTFKSVFSADKRMSQLTDLPGIGGAQCIDAQAEKSAVSYGDDIQVYDVRSCRRALPTSPSPAGTEALKMQWLNRDVLAVSDQESHVHSQTQSGDSFSFNSNRVKIQTAAVNSVQTRPIYALRPCPTDAEVLVTGGGDRHSYIWNHVRRSMKAKLKLPMACMASSYSADGQRSAVGMSSDEWITTDAKFAECSRSKIVSLTSIPTSPE